MMFTCLAMILTVTDETLTLADAEGPKPINVALALWKKETVKL